MVLTGTKRVRGTSSNAARRRSSRSPRPSRSRAAAPASSRVARIDGLAVDDERQLEHAVALLQERRRSAQVDPQVVGVVVAPVAVVAKRVGVLVGGVWADSRSTSCPSARRRAMWPPLRSASVPSHDLHQERDLLARDVRGDARIDGRAEVVGVGDHRVAKAAARAARRAAPSAAARRRRRRGRAGTTPAPGRRASRPARASSASSLGIMLCRKSSGEPGVELGVRASASAVSACVASLFIRISGSARRDGGAARASDR